MPGTELFQIGLNFCERIREVTGAHPVFWIALGFVIGLAVVPAVLA